MKVWLLALATWLVCALLISCVALPPDVLNPPNECDRVYYVWDNFDSGERAALEHANKRFNALANKKFCLVSGNESEHSIRRIEYGGPEWLNISKDFGGANVLGVYTGRTDNIVIVSTLPLALFELVALHEIGHAHGLDHIAEAGIMHASVGTADDFTLGDIAECVRVGACGSGAPEVSPFKDYFLQ